MNPGHIMVFRPTTGYRVHLCACPSTATWRASWGGHAEIRIWAKTSIVTFTQLGTREREQVASTFEWTGSRIPLHPVDRELGFSERACVVCRYGETSRTKAVTEINSVAAWPCPDATPSEQG
ncbi:hypothetical protein M8818_004483 [Zalaria obscura]|uniref:Uncharacterized protein n=1 Tax=Zalaria obscura TaxID=2024903 RepID=A0ACC3SB88_9PEZI